MTDERGEGSGSAEIAVLVAGDGQVCVARGVNEAKNSLPQLHRGGRHVGVVGGVLGNHGPAGLIEK